MKSVKVMCCVVLMVSCIFTGCSTSKINEAAQALSSLGGSLYAPKHYADETFYEQLKSLDQGKPIAATAFNPVGTKTVLSGLSTFFQGQKQSIDKNLFEDKTIFTLTAIMEVRRSQVLEQIRKGLENDNYLLGEALLDLEEYYRAGSLYTALQAAHLNQPTSKSSDKADDAVRKSNTGESSRKSNSDETNKKVNRNEDKGLFPASTSPK